MITNSYWNLTMLQVLSSSTPKQSYDVSSIKLHFTGNETEMLQIEAYTTMSQWFAHI